MSDPKDRSPEEQAELDQYVRNSTVRTQDKQRRINGEELAPKRQVTLADLPLFADERSLSDAILGRGRFSEWRAVIPLLEYRGFPKIDALMGGRYVPAVKAFFDREYRVMGHELVSAPHSPAKLGASHDRSAERLGSWAGHGKSGGRRRT